MHTGHAIFYSNYFVRAYFVDVSALSDPTQANDSQPTECPSRTASDLSTMVKVKKKEMKKAEKKRRAEELKQAEAIVAVSSGDGVRRAKKARG